MYMRRERRRNAATVGVAMRPIDRKQALRRLFDLFYAPFAALMLATVFFVVCLAVILGPTLRIRRAVGRFGVRLATDRLAYYSHWITPKGLPKIFDTRFFITEAPAGQTAVADATEQQNSVIHSLDHDIHQISALSAQGQQNLQATLQECQALQQQFDQLEAMVLKFKV